MIDYLEVAHSWLSPIFDKDTREEVENMIKNAPLELEDAFYKTLEFGTGGLRGVMGVGTNRMNKYTVGMATQGFANYIKRNFAQRQEIRVAIAYDCRNNSESFAKIVGGIFAQNGFKVYLFDALRPTPELSFAIRHLGCQAGVMLTASHNPKEYNGYKAYWEDGAQITYPHDANIIAEVKAIKDPSEVLFSEEPMKQIELIGEEIDKIYLDTVLSQCLSPESVLRNKDIKIVYTPLHGTGVKLVPQALRQLGFENIVTVKPQCETDGNFPTVFSPNPEEPSALEMALRLAKEEEAQIVMATDPDADRLGVAMRTKDGSYKLLTGNQTAALLTYYVLSRRADIGTLSPKSYIIKTIVTTELMKAIAESFDVKVFDVLTGFKYIAEVVRENEGSMEFVCGGEESYGFNIGEYVRDKDAVISCAMLAECAAWAADQGYDLEGLMEKIYSEYGYYMESLISVTKKGKDGAEEIQLLMKQYRENPPRELAGSPVVKIIDYLESEKTGLEKSNVLRFFAEDGSVVAVRPSGTEPKIKYYFGVKGDRGVLEEKIKQLEQIFK